MHKKKPVHTIYHAHGLAPPPTPAESSAETAPDQNPPCPAQPRYITALATVAYSDLVVSGSWDGHVRVWKVSADKKKLERVCAVGATTDGGKDVVRGVVNAIAVFERGEKGKEGLVICVATAREMRKGKWMKVSARNGGVVLEVDRAVLEAENGVTEVGNEMEEAA